MTKIIILTSKVSEESAKVLSTLMNADIDFPYDSKNRDYTGYDYVFKYGFSRLIKAKKGTTFNRTGPTEIAKNKILTFEALKDKDITVEYTQDINCAHKWIQDGHTVVSRDTADGSNGAGIKYCTTRKEVDSVKALFWTKCIYEKQELRVNLWRNKVLSIYVKTVNEGVFDFSLVKGNENHPQLVNIAQTVYDKVGLDFCGLDLLTDDTGRLYLLEVNSAPILFPYTAKKLVAEINKETKK